MKTETFIETGKNMQQQGAPEAVVVFALRSFYVNQCIETIDSMPDLPQDISESEKDAELIQVVGEIDSDWIKICHALGLSKYENELLEYARLYCSSMHSALMIGRLMRMGGS